MAGSKGCKHSKGEGKSNSKKSDVINNIPKISNNEPAQIPHNNPEPAQILHNNPEPAQILHNNPDGPNNSNNIKLQQSGRQYISNIFVDSSYESCSKSKDDGSAAEKIPSESNIDSLAKKVGSVKRINHTNAVASMLKEKIPILTAAIKQEIGGSVVDQQAVQSSSSKITEASDISSPDVIRFITGSSYEASVKGFLEINPNDPKLAQIVDLVKDIRDLNEKAKEQKEWAQQKVIDSAKKVSKDLIELKTLRMEKVDREQREIQKKSVESSFILKPKEQALQNASCQLNSVNGSVRRLELENARIRADIEALKLSALESDSALKEALKREKRSLKRHADLEKQIGRLQADCYEEKQRMLQLQNELLQAKNEIEAAEMQWRQEIKEKEQMLARLAEEIKLTEIRKANSRAQLSKLRQKLEIDNQLVKDNLHRLEDEMSGLLLSRQMSSVSVEDDNFFYDSIGGITFESNALVESLENNSPHSKCMFCSHREVSVLFLPCAHQVLCSHCFEHNSITAGGQCPYCHVEIEQRIRVYGPSS